MHSVTCCKNNVYVCLPAAAHKPGPAFALSCSTSVRSKQELYFPRLSLLHTRELINTDACAPPGAWGGWGGGGVSALENSHIFVGSRTASLTLAYINSDTDLECSFSPTGIFMFFMKVQTGIRCDAGM